MSASGLSTPLRGGTADLEARRRVRDRDACRARRSDRWFRGVRLLDDSRNVANERGTSPARPSSRGDARHRRNACILRTRTRRLGRWQFRSGTGAGWGAPRRQPRADTCQDAAPTSGPPLTAALRRCADASPAVGYGVAGERRTREKLRAARRETRTRNVHPAEVACGACGHAPQAGLTRTARRAPSPPA